MPVFIALFLIFPLSGCRPGGISEGGKNEEKPNTQGPSYTPPQSKGDSQAAMDKTFHGTYAVTVRRKDSDKVVCQGTAEIVNYTSFTHTYGKIPCKDDLIIGAFVKQIIIGTENPESSKTLSPDDIHSLGLDPRVRYATQTGKTRYIPYKPDLLGPIIQDQSSYANIDFQIPVSAEVETGNPQKPLEKGTGTVQVKVLGINESYKPSETLGTYNKVIRYQINSNGFEGISDKAHSGLFQKYEYRWNTQPLALLHVHVEGPVQDFEKSEFKGIAGNIIFGGGLVVDLNLQTIVYGP